LFAPEALNAAVIEQRIRIFATDDDTLDHRPPRPRHDRANGRPDRCQEGASKTKRVATDAQRAPGARRQNKTARPPGGLIIVRPPAGKSQPLRARASSTIVRLPSRTISATVRLPAKDQRNRPASGPDDQRHDGVRARFAYAPCLSRRLRARFAYGFPLPSAQPQRDTRGERAHPSLPPAS
jgi:hypothetical protein